MAIKHVVIWSLLHAEDATRFKTLLDGCGDLVPGILEFQVGLKTAGLEANAEVVLVSCFADEAALSAYQNHPHHLEVAKALGAMREQRHVVDFYTD